MSPQRPFCIVLSAFLIREASSGITCSIPVFWTSPSRPEMETDTAACFQSYSAAVNTSLGEMFSTS
jgi:hypothetical protein